MVPGQDVGMEFKTRVERESVVDHVHTEPRKTVGNDTTVYTRDTIVHEFKIFERDLPDS